MAERTVVPLLYGAGLDRATGLFSRDGASGLDLRNILLYRDKAQVRHGHARVNTLVDESGNPLSDVVLAAPMSAEQIGLVVGYGNDGRVHLFRTGGDGIGLAQVGILFTLTPLVITAGAHVPPRVFAAEQYGKVFFAHDEATRMFRAPTQYYDPFGSSALNPLLADLDGDGTPGPVLFRGVTPYLSYLVGWGYGTETDPDKPHIVRVSDPEVPTLLSPDDYFPAGTGGTPVLNCVPAGTPDNSCLLVFKPTELHQIFGYDRNSFGIRQIEDKRGLAASRLAISLGGVVYFWSNEGPRYSSGGPSGDLAVPLDLDAPAPADLVAEGLVDDGFACYLPSRRCILFVFGRRVYVLNVWDPAQPKWSYGELGFAAQCGAILYTGGETAAAPTGSPSNVSLVLTPGNTDNAIDVTFQNNGLTGGEVAELWAHAVTPDTWALCAQAAASGNVQTVTTSVQAGTKYEMQVRYRRGPFYGAGYTGAPASWPVASLSTNQVTTTLAAPVLLADYRRVSAALTHVTLRWLGNRTVASKVKVGATVVATIPPNAPALPGVLGLLSIPTFGPGTTDTQLAFDGCDYVIAAAPYVLPASVAAGVVLPAGTIPAGKWGSFLVSVDEAQAVTITPAPLTFTTGYADEASALAAVPTLPVDEAQLLSFTIQAQAVNPWISGTDALQGGVSGNPAQATCYYPVDPITLAGQLSYVVVGGGAGTYEIDQDQPDVQVNSGAVSPSGVPVPVAVVGAFTTCGNTFFKVAWTNNGRDLVRLSYIFHAIETEVERTIGVNALVDVPGALLTDVVQPSVQHVQTHFGVDDLAPTFTPCAWGPQVFSAVLC